MSRWLQNRRDFFKNVGLGAAVTALQSCAKKQSHAHSVAAETPSSAIGIENEKLYWGEIHTHSFLSDGNGDPGDQFEIAKSHLDFWSMTDHAFDEKVFSLDYRKYSRKDRKRRLVNEAWGEVQQLCRTYEEPGRFIPILGYEWTNFLYGHHNIYYLDYDQPIRMSPTLPDLYAALRDVEAMVIPHHTGYPLKICGKDWDYHDERLTPFVELYSMHGSSETPEGVRLLLTTGSWMGPGSGEGCVQAGLARGYKLGIMASSDSHMDHPGAYDLGLMATYAKDLTRQSLWDAFKRKRIYGITGDRIGLDFAVNGQPMGSTARGTGKRIIQVAASGWDKIERIEIIKNNRLFHTFTEPGVPSPIKGKTRFRFLIEMGWDARSEHDWAGSLNVAEGKIHQAIPCYRGTVGGRVGTGIKSMTDNECLWTSKSEKAKYDGLARRFADVVAFEVESLPSAILKFRITCDQLEQNLELKASEILDKSLVRYMEDIPVTLDGNYWANMKVCSKFKVHKGWPVDQLTVNLTCEDAEVKQEERKTDFYYVRLFQRNLQRAWSSPVWVERI